VSSPLTEMGLASIGPQVVEPGSPVSKRMVFLPRSKPLPWACYGSLWGTYSTWRLV